MFKVLLFTVLLALSTAYTQEENVLVLTDNDFPAVLSEFSHILIQFYAPWCGHCKQLAPVYQQVASELKAQGSVVRLAKVDATVQKKAGQQFQVQGFPTLYFFLNGQKIDYSGQRSKESMLNWLLKKTRDPVVQIEKEGYEKLASSDSVSIVYHGDFSTAEGANVFNQIALADDYNTYYWGKDLGKQSGTIELIRSFDSSVTYSTIDDGLKDWVSKNQRPLVVSFDERTISDIFGSSKLGIVLFNGLDNNVLLDAFSTAAKEYSQTDGEAVIFTEINSNNEHLANFAEYIKIDHEKSPVIMVNAGAQQKFVFKGEVSKQNILDFISNYQSFEYGITDEVKYEEEATPTEEEL